MYNTGWTNQGRINWGWNITAPLRHHWYIFLTALTMSQIARTPHQRDTTDTASAMFHSYSPDFSEHFRTCISDLNVPINVRMYSSVTLCFHRVQTPYAV
jgi:hypothetical protein